MKPRDAAAIRQIENIAAEVHGHVHGAANYATSGDFHRAHAKAGQARGATRRLEELLAALAAAADRIKPAGP